MKAAVLGAGSIGKGNSVYLASSGCDVTLWDRKEDRLSPIRNGITASGQREGLFRIPVTRELPEALQNADLILVCTIASGHRPVAEAMKGHLPEGADIIVTNCCWGAVEFRQILGEEADRKHVRISETAGQLILCSSPSPDAVFLKTIKKEVFLACTDPRETDAVLERIAPFYPRFSKASSVLDTSLNNTNMICHGPMALYSFSRLENGEDYLLFRTAATRRVCSVMDKIDAERVRVMEKCGIPVLTNLEILNSFWPDKRDSVYDVLHMTKAYSVTKGPATAEHRFITEDMPFGLVPVVQLGKRFGVPTPSLETVVSALSLVMDTDYFSMGPDLSKLDLKKYL